MRILFNDEPMQCAESLTLHGLLEQLNQLKPGMALALNQQIIPRDRWDYYQLRDGDRILLFQVIAGG